MIEHHAHNVATDQWPCSNCSQRFSSHLLLASHFSDCHKDGNFVCSLCDCACDTIAAIKSHLLTDHSQPDSDSVQQHSHSLNNGKVPKRVPPSALSTSADLNESNESPIVKKRQRRTDSPGQTRRRRRRVASNAPIVQSARMVIRNLRCIIEDCGTVCTNTQLLTQHMNEQHGIRRHPCWTRNCLASFDTP